jgi:hypothetical protein
MLIDKTLCCSYTAAPLYGSSLTITRGLCFGNSTLTGYGTYSLDDSRGSGPESTTKYQPALHSTWSGISWQPRT